jgi:hypothetical protein
MTTADALLGQAVAGWGLDARRMQDTGDEFALGVGVGVPVVAVLAGEAFLQVRVVRAKARIGAQGDDGLGRQAGYRRGTDVLDRRSQPWRKDGRDPGLLVGEQVRPRPVVLG